VIPYSKQSINELDIAAVVDVLQSKFLTQGPMIETFESELAKFTSSSHATLLSSATAALHLSILALGVGPGDIVWTVPNSFVASANCALYAGASIDFVDIDESTFNISVIELEKKLSLSSKIGKLPKVLIIVHFAGEPCDMHEIRRLSKKYNFFIVEDASHALGAKYENKYIGECSLSDIAVFSFHAIKSITTGEGCAALTNCNNIDKKLKLLRAHGILKGQHSSKLHENGDWFYEQIDLGFNYRMTDIQATSGFSQIKRLKTLIKQRNELSKIYDMHLPREAIITQRRCEKNQSALHLYAIRVPKLRRKQTFKAMRKKGIMVGVHYIPIHTHPYFQNLGFKVGDFPISEEYYQEALSLPLHVELRPDEQSLIIETLTAALKDDC